MGRDMEKSMWPEVKEKIKLNWDKLEDQDLDPLKGQLNKLSEKIQKIYNYSFMRAEREVNDFKKELSFKKRH